MDLQALSEISIDQRLKAAIELAQLCDHSVFALSARPRPEARLKTLFAGNDATLVRLFNEPPALRRTGFGLEHGGNSRIIIGELRRALVQSWKILELWRDGTLIYAVDALVQPFWGSPQPDGRFRLNPLALAEPVYLFAKLSVLVYEEAIRPPSSVEYGVLLQRIGEAGRPASLAEGPLDSTYFECGPSHLAPSTEMSRLVSVEWQKGIEPGVVAYEILQEVYHWFGISDDHIPYTKNANGLVAIDPEALVEAGRR